MSLDFLQTVLSNIWVVFLVVLLFGGSIFVHELGHFLAARRRGAYVDRFSIGFGPAIWSWRGKDGVEYRISWIPLGGYVLLPQLADLSAVEGESRVDARKLLPVGYATKMIVFVAGAAFNILFAFALACVVWIIGQPVASPLDSTTIAEVLPKVKNAQDVEVPSPALQAGLQPGDVIVAIDGSAIKTFNEIVEHLALSSGWTAGGERETVVTVQRGNQKLDFRLHPVIGGLESTRIIGIAPLATFEIEQVTPGSPAARAGLLPQDKIIEINGAPTPTVQRFRDAFRAAKASPLVLTVTRAGERKTIEFPKGAEADLGFGLKTGIIFSHPSPFEQIASSIRRTISTVMALVNPRSDIGLKHVQGPIGIINNFVDVSRAGLPFALWFTILVNVNLAILNLLPVPVLDGGQMLFATIARLRGRALPTNFIVAAQSVFLVLIFAMIGYVSFFSDIPRIVRDARADRAAAEAAARDASNKTPPAQPVTAPAAPAK